MMKYPLIFFSLVIFASFIYFTKAGGLVPSKLKTEQSDSISETFSVEEIAISVTVLPTQDNTPEVILSPPVYPKTTKVSLPQGYKDKLEAYGASEKIILGPKGWTGEGTIGSNGNTIIRLFPHGGSVEKGPHITVSDVPACYICALDAGASYFSQARDSLIRSQFSIPEIAPGVTIKAISLSLVEYSWPITSDGLQITGVAQLNVNENAAGPPFVEIEIALPKEEQNLAKIIRNYFKTSYLLN